MLSTRGGDALVLQMLFIVYLEYLWPAVQSVKGSQGSLHAMKTREFLLIGLQSKTHAQGKRDRLSELIGAAVCFWPSNTTESQEVVVWQVSGRPQVPHLSKHFSKSLRSKTLHVYLDIGPSTN